MTRVIQRLTPEESQELSRVMAWVVETCLIFGAQHHTAYKVAGAFGEGVERAWLERKTVSQT